MKKPIAKQNKTPSMIGVRERTIGRPNMGWYPQTYYLVDVAFSENNVIHRKIFYSGFLNAKDGGPGGYNEFGFCEDHFEIHDAYYLEVVAKIDMWPDLTEQPA